MTKEQLVTSIMVAIMAANSKNDLAKDLGVKIVASGLLADLQDALRQCDEQKLVALNEKYAPKQAQATNAKIDDVVSRLSSGS